MPRCIDCAHFPWNPKASLFGTPAARCHPSLPIRRWTDETARVQHDCPEFKARGGVAEVEATEAPEEMTVAELRAFAARTDDVAVLQDLLVREEARENPRVTAIRMLKDRLDELEGENSRGETDNAEEPKTDQS